MFFVYSGFLCGSKLYLLIQQFWGIKSEDFGAVSTALTHTHLRHMVKGKTTAGLSSDLHYMHFSL